MDEIPEFQHKPEKKPNYREGILRGKKKEKWKNKRKKINPVSKKKSSWLIKYKKKKEKDNHLQKCPKCDLIDIKFNMEPHHTHGRSNENIMIYVWMCPSCHAWVHANPNKARDLGLLFF